jgi:Glycosyl hydrolases family 43
MRIVLTIGPLRALLATLVAAAGTITLASVGVVTAPAASAANWAPVHAGDFPDPSVLAWDGVYYGFSTQNFAPTGQTINIQVSTSIDGVTWTALNGVDALPNLPSWAEEGDTWAPSVVYDSNSTPGTFVMYYVATDTDSGDQCIGMATALDPLGPYVDNSAEPIICQTSLGGSIDPDVFTDNSGSNWLIWKNDGNHIGTSSSIWSVPLNEHYQLDGGSAVQLLTATASSWQSNIVEGPDMYETPTTNTFYLFYSGSQVDTSAYGIGWASCPSGPAAPCTDESVSAPLLGTQPGVSGPGGPDVYTLPGGQPVLAFAGWQGTTIGYLSCGIRPMYLADLNFGGVGSPPAPVLSPNDPNEAPATSPTCPQPPVPQPGYWQVAADGGVFTFGSAGFFGSTGSMRLNKPVVGMAVTPDHQGYWLVASDGGVFAFGDAPFYGSAGGDNLAYPVTAAAPSYLGGGYWMVDSNGQVFTYGNAHYEGQPQFAPGGYRITGMAATHNSNGYWLASANGNVATFGNAPNYGSEIGTALNAPIVGMSETYDGNGYWLQGSDGGIFTFGDAPFLGSMGGQHLNAPMVGIAGV